MAIVTLVGRPNVGKSSLFNRIIGKKVAIVDDVPGVTRDRLYGVAEYGGKRFFVVDTGGLMASENLLLRDLVERQVSVAVAESDVVLFVVDGREPLTPIDFEIAQLLRKSGKKVLVVFNKIDHSKHEEALLEAYALGFPNVLGVSAEHNRNMDLLLDEIVKELPEEAIDEEDGEEIRVALVGRPNVGKSSLLNCLVGSERSLVSEMPGTTRDAVDSLLILNERRFRLIDTAGLRKRSRIDSSLEFYSTVRTYQAIDHCHVAVVLLDATELVTEQDKRVIGYIWERGKGLVVAVNKWDLIPRDPKAGDAMMKTLREELVFAREAPVLFISAKSGRGVAKIPEAVIQVNENRRRRIPTPELNRLVREVLVFDRMPTDGKGRILRISYCTQADGVPPAFVFFVNNPEIPQKTNRSFERHVEKLIREMADFRGVPIRLFWRQKS